MEMNAFINFLLESLDDSRVKEKVRNIIETNSDSKCTNIFNHNKREDRDKIKKLKEEIDSIKRENESLKEQFKSVNSQLEQENEERKKLNEIIIKEKIKTAELTKQIEELHSELIDKANEIKEKDKKICELSKSNENLNSEKKKVIQEKNFYEKCFSNIVKYYKKYSELDSVIKQELNSVIKSDSPELFFASGIQWENIEALWQFISYKFSDYSKSNSDILIDIFRYFFEKYNEIYNLYEMMTVNIGDEFDEDFHTRGNNSRVSGNISEIILPGYKNIRNHKIVQKSIVRV